MTSAVTNDNVKSKFFDYFNVESSRQQRKLRYEWNTVLTRKASEKTFGDIRNAFEQFLTRREAGKEISAFYQTLESEQKSGLAHNLLRAAVQKVDLEKEEKKLKQKGWDVVSSCSSYEHLSRPQTPEAASETCAS
jgi:predicted GNAT family acetyltransferase